VDKELISNGPLLLHWDGKLLLDIIDSKKTVDRIAVLVTGGGEEICLEFPKLEVQPVKSKLMPALANGMNADLWTRFVGWCNSTSA